MHTISVVFSNGKYYIPAQNEADSLYQDGYGSKIESNTVALEPHEALYLLENERISVIHEYNRKAISFHEVLNESFLTDSQIWIQYIVYRDIRNRGFVAKKIKNKNLDFLVFERGEYSKKPPAIILHAVIEGEAESVGHFEDVLNDTVEGSKILKLAVIDRRGEIVYYGLDQLFNR